MERLVCREETAKRTDINKGSKTLLGHFNPLTTEKVTINSHGVWGFMDWTSNLPASNFHIAAINSECSQHLLNGTPYSRAAQERCCCWCCCWRCHLGAGPLIKHRLLWPYSLTPLQLNYYSGPLSNQAWRKGELNRSSGYVPSCWGR